MKQIFFLILIAISVWLSADNNEQFLAADQSLMIMPTAYTMPKGTSAFTNFELVLMQYSYAATERMHLTTAMVFPFTKEMLKTFSVGGKYNYYRADKTQSALWTSYTPDPSIMTLGNIVSYGSPKLSGHFLAATVSSLKEGETRMVFGLGAINSHSKRISSMAEFFYMPKNTIELWDTDSDSMEEIKILSIGMRFKGESISWDFGAIRPLEDIGDDVFFFPFLKATFQF